MRIPENKIEEIRSSCSIVDVISEFVQLRKRGKNFVGLCPFHNEKTPSFTVSDEKQIFHCFGCHTGGNVFKFLMEYKKISFVESVQEIAEQLGIDLQFEQGRYEEQQSQQEVFFDINTEAAKYFLNNLLNEDEAEIARNYLQKRNVKTQTARAFGLGYSLRGWENLLNYLKQKGIKQEDAHTLGLIGKSDDGRFFDKLPGRLIFPIFSPNGRVVAFAGRKLDPSEKGGKYINSPESIVYSKSRVLYGLSFAKDEIRRLNKAVIVEGYMDLISLYQHGIKNVVAVSGTALTDEQVQLLSRYTKDVVLLFDADTAGMKASMRSIEVLLKHDMEVKIVSLPEGEDPDSYVQKFGKDKFDDLLKKAENFIEYQTRYFDSLGRFNDPASAAKTIREIVQSLALYNDELKRNLLIKSISKKFNLREKLLESELEKILQNMVRNQQPQNRVLDKAVIEKGTHPEIEVLKKNKPLLYNLEKEIITQLYEGDKKTIQFLIENITAEDFEVKAHKALANNVITSAKENEEMNVDRLINRIQDDELESYLREITLGKHSISSNWEERNPAVTPEMVKYKFIKDTVLRFRLLKLDEHIKQNHAMIEKAIDEDEILALMNSNRELEKEKKELKQSFEELKIE